MFVRCTGLYLSSYANFAFVGETRVSGATNYFKLCSAYEIRYLIYLSSRVSLYLAEQEITRMNPRKCSG